MRGMWYTLRKNAFEESEKLLLPIDGVARLGKHMSSIHVRRQYSLGCTTWTCLPAVAQKVFLRDIFPHPDVLPVSQTASSRRLWGERYGPECRNIRWHKDMLVAPINDPCLSGERSRLARWSRHWRRSWSDEEARRPQMIHRTP